MDDSVCILYENINPHAEVEFMRENRRAEENDELQESIRNFVTTANTIWKDRSEWNPETDSVISLDELEEDSSNDVPLINQDVFEDLQDEDFILSSPGIMVDTDDDTDEELEQFDKIQRLFQQVKQDFLPRRSKRNNVDSVNQAEVASHEGEPSTSFKIPKASLSDRKVKKPKTEQPILPLERHPFYSIPPSFSSNHHISDNMFLLPPDDPKPGCSRASTSAPPTVHNWAYQPTGQQPLPQEPDHETMFRQKAHELHKLLHPLPSTEQKSAQTPSTASTSALHPPDNWTPQPSTSRAPHNWDQPPPIGEWWTEPNEWMRKQQAPKQEPLSNSARQTRILQNLNKLISSTRFPLPSDDQEPARTPSTASALPPPHNWEYQPPPTHLQAPRQETFMPRFKNIQRRQNLTSSLHRLSSGGQTRTPPPPHSAAASTSALPLFNWMDQPLLPVPPPPNFWGYRDFDTQQQAPRQQEPPFNADGRTDAQFFENLDNILTNTLRRLPSAAEKPARIPPPNSRTNTFAPPPAHSRIARRYHPLGTHPSNPRILPHQLQLPPPFQRQPKRKATNAKKPKQPARMVLPEDINLPYRGMLGLVDDHFVRMFPPPPPIDMAALNMHELNRPELNFLPEFNFPAFNMPPFIFPPIIDEYPELATASKPKPQESYQKEKKLKTWKEEFEKDDYNTLVALNDMGLVANVEPFECPICFTKIPVGEGVLLHDCLHSFCRDCLEGTIEHSDTVLVKCPFANEEYLCESHLQDREIKALVSPDIYEKHLARSLALAESQAPDSYHCKTPDCPGWCLIEADNVGSFVCPACKMTNCLTCGAVHQGRNCKQYQDWLLEMESDTSKETKKTRECLKNMVTKGKAMECPVCHVILMKVSGCDALTCRMCRTQLCWVTKKTRWGPGGFGDTSGGCKCDLLNGVRCHPQCTGCH